MRFLLFLSLLVISCDNNSSDPNNSTNECIDYTCWNLDSDGVLDNYHDFQFNGSITSAVMNGSQSIANSNDILGAVYAQEGMKNPPIKRRKNKRLVNKFLDKW